MGHYKNGIETKAALHRSAQICFYRKGYTDTSVRDIVDPIHINSSLFFYYFKSKENAAVEIFWEYADQVEKLVQDALEEPLRQYDLLTEDILVYLAFFQSLVFNENTARFYRQISALSCYLEKEFRVKKYYYDRMRRPEIMGERYKDNLEQETFFISVTSGMELQVCRDVCSGRITAAREAFAYLAETYYGLLVPDRQRVLTAMERAQQMMQTIDLQVSEGFIPSVRRK